MRIPLLVLALVALPSVSGAQPSSECRRYTRQIEHFAGVVQMAEERGNDLWEQETRRHIERLETRRAERCPEYRPGPGAMAEAKEMLGKATKLAAKWFLLQ
ncbi:MAG: hypothetical protein ABFS46_02165 [Myxococcota bacterium]